MENFFKKSFYPSVSQLQNRRFFSTAGNVLIYVVVLMLIFGALGVVMVSMFTSSTASTVTRNDTRRARYLAESGVRYAASELREADFEEDIIIVPLNTLTYTVSGAGSFDPNIFSPWFDSNASVNSPDVISLNVPLGDLPDDFTAPAANGVWVVNYDFITGENPDLTTMRDGVISFAKNGTSLDVDITADFVAGEDERICLAVEPTEDRAITEGADLYVARDARLFFPPFNGAISINRVDYAYERLVDDQANNRVILENVTASQFPNTLSADQTVRAGTGASPYDGHFVILSPRNYMVMAEGTSDGVTWGDAYAQGVNVYDHSLIRPESRKPDITADEYTSSIPSRSPYITIDTDADTLNIGSGRTPAVGAEFDTAFYGGDQSIGGEQDYCAQGACLFNLGVRAFFLLDFDSQGDGITFTLTSFGPPLTPHNSATSVGGDIQLSELIGYAGDSRLVPDADPLNDLDFLATNPNDRGLDPPKIAVEFDTRTNNAADDPPPDYCSGADANADTRNDPLTSNKDAVQYVFWGRTNFLNIPCRGLPPPPPPLDISNPLYDDNRHDADGEEPKEEWRFGMGGASSIWRPAIGSDGTIYMSASDATLYALNEDGTLKWTFNLLDNNDYMPGIDTKGTSDPSDDVIYSDISGNNIVAIDWEGSELWRFGVASDIDSTPVIGPDGRVYFGTDAEQSLFAIDPIARAADLAFPQLGEWQFPTSGEVDNVAVLSPDGTTVYFVSNDDNLYALKMAAREADPTGAGGINNLLGEWTFPILAESGEVNSSPTVNPNDGTIYVGSDDQNVYAINPDGTEKWRFNPGTGSDIESSPTVAIDPRDSKFTVYIGSDDNNVYAIDADTGAEKWRFNTGADVVSSPVVDLDGTIYVGSNDNNVYAINPDGTQKWFFATGGAVPSSPALGQAGFIHIGSNDTNFYTISQFADPRNFKDENKIEGKLLTWEDLGVDPIDLDDTNDWLNGRFGLKELWAVRLEVDRSLIPNADGKFDYQLSLWIRQCQNLDCSDINGTFFSDTRIDYENAPVGIPNLNLPMIQQFRLSAAEQAEFERFFFGFTGATGVGQTQSAIISQFNLSFIRPGDPVVNAAAGDDLGWSP